MMPRRELCELVSWDCINGGVCAWNLGDRRPNIQLARWGVPGSF